LPFEYVQICVYYDPHTHKDASTRVNVNAALSLVYSGAG